MFQHINPKGIPQSQSYTQLSMMKCKSYPTLDTFGFLAGDPTAGGIPKQKKQLKKGLTKTFKSLQFQQSDGKYDVTVQFNAGSESLVLEFMDKSDTRTFWGKFNKETIRRITRECPLSVANLSEVIKDQLSSTDFINKFCRLFEFKNLYHGIFYLHCVLFICFRTFSM